MRFSLVVVACALALGACRSDDELAMPDLSSASLYCPSDPPADGSFVCDPTAIPFCTYPAQQITCRCSLVGAGYVLVCPTTDLGVSEDLGIPADLAISDGGGNAD